MLKASAETKKHVRYAHLRPISQGHLNQAHALSIQGTALSKGESICAQISDCPAAKRCKAFSSAVAQTESCRTSTQPSQKRTGVADCASTSLQGFCSRRFSHARKLHAPSQCRCQEPPKWKRRRQPKLLTSPEAPAEAQDHT